MCTHTFVSHMLTYMHAQAGAHTQHPAASRAVLYMCDAVSGRGADKLHNTERHSGSSVPWKMSRLVSSQHCAPHLMFAPPPTLTPFVPFSHDVAFLFLLFITFPFFSFSSFWIPFFYVFYSCHFALSSVPRTFHLLHSTWHHPLHLVLQTHPSMISKNY